MPAPARQSQWRGPFELECMAGDDHVHLIEINPRFPAWVYLATGVGLNLPSRLLRAFVSVVDDVFPFLS